MLVYAITNNVNGKQYIGWTTHNLNIRWNQHMYEHRKGRRKGSIYSAMKKYGSENFEISILEETDDVSRETYWIEKLGTYENGYNMSYGKEQGESGHLAWEGISSEDRSKILKERSMKQPLHIKQAACKKMAEVINKKVKCPHCDKIGQYRAMKRWHFDNCRDRKKQ